MPAVPVEPVTEVAQRVAAVVREEAVLPMPPLAVGGVEGVDVDIAAVAVERVALRGGAEAVHACTVVGEPAEDVAHSAVRPVLVDDELGDRAAPVGEMELPVPLAAAVVGLEPLPRLQGPVASVRRLARFDEPGKRRPVVGQADSAATFSVTDPEADLTELPVGLAGVDRTRGDEHL